MRTLSREVAFDQRRHVAFLGLQVVRAVALPALPRLGSAQIKVTGDDMGVELRRADGGVIAVEVVGEPGATPVLFCHGLADSRLSAHSFAGAAHEFGLRLIAPDRPGIGGTNARRWTGSWTGLRKRSWSWTRWTSARWRYSASRGAERSRRPARPRCPTASEACC